MLISAFLSWFSLCDLSRARVSCSGLLRGGVNPLQKEKATHIIDDIGQADPHGGPRYAYGSDEQSRL